MIRQLMRKYWMRRTPPKIQTEVLFYGDRHISRIDDRGRIYVPVSIVRGRTPGREERGFLESDLLYFRRENYGVYVTLLTPDMEEFYVRLPYNDSWRSIFFEGNFAILKKIGTNGRHGERITLDIRLAGIDVKIEPNGDYFKVLLYPSDLRRLNWGSFLFTRNNIKERLE